MKAVSHPCTTEPQTTFTVEQEGNVLLSTFPCRSELGVRAVDHPVHAAVVVAIVVGAIMLVIVVIVRQR
jgi:hypothetical protein